MIWLLLEMNICIFENVPFDIHVSHAIWTKKKTTMYALRVEPVSILVTRSFSVFISCYLSWHTILFRTFIWCVCVCFFSYLFTFGAILNKLKRTFQDMDPNNDKKNNLYICMYINISWTHFDGIIQNVIYIFQLGVCLSTLCHCW